MVAGVDVFYDESFSTCLTNWSREVLEFNGRSPELLKPLTGGSTSAHMKTKDKTQNN